jgi:hypothetical protein
MQQHIRVRVALPALFAGDLLTAEHQRTALHQSVHIVADTNAKHTLPNLVFGLGYSFSLHPWLSAMWFTVRNTRADCRTFPATS